MSVGRPKTGTCFTFWIRKTCSWLWYLEAMSYSKSQSVGENGSPANRNQVFQSFSSRARRDMLQHATGWWWLEPWNFMTFHMVGKNYPNWLICFRGVETTNQAKMELAALLRAHLDEKLRPSSPAKESPAQCAMARGLFNFQKGTPWECGFSLHSATTDTAHVRWFSHCFAAIDNSAWFFWNG